LQIRSRPSNFYNTRSGKLLSKTKRTLTLWRRFIRRERPSVVTALSIIRSCTSRCVSLRYSPPCPRITRGTVGVQWRRMRTHFSRIMSSHSADEILRTQRPLRVRQWALPCSLKKASASHLRMVEFHGPSAGFDLANCIVRCCRGPGLVLSSYSSTIFSSAGVCSTMSESHLKSNSSSKSRRTTLFSHC
jgi:hypothetical protein